MKRVYDIKKKDHVVGVIRYGDIHSLNEAEKEKKTVGRQHTSIYKSKLGLCKAIEDTGVDSSVK